MCGVLSATDGSHLGVVVRQIQKGVGIPFFVAWHSESTSLIVALREDVCYLKVFSVKD